MRRTLPRRRDLAALLLVLALALSACSVASSPAATSTARARPTATAVPSATPEPVTHLLFTGDIIPARCVYANVSAIGDWTAPFQPLHDILAAADITIGTLDATVSDAGTPIGCVETFSLAGPAAAASGLAYAGYDVISHAANHIKDCGVSPCGNNARSRRTSTCGRRASSASGTGRTWRRRARRSSSSATACGSPSLRTTTSPTTTTRRTTRRAPRRWMRRPSLTTSPRRGRSRTS